MFPRTLRLLLVPAVLVLLAGCGGEDSNPGDMSQSDTAGDTSDTVGDAPTDAPTDTPGDQPVDVPADVPVDTPVDTTMDVPVDAPVDMPVDMGMDMTMQPTLQSERFFGVALALIDNASIRTPVMLTDLSTDVEWLVVREFRGWTEVQNGETMNVIFAVNDAVFNRTEVGWESGPLPMGSYDTYLENLGENGDNDYVAAKLIRKPSFDPAVATFASTIVELDPLLDPNGANYLPFTVQAGHRYVIRGIRGKNEVYVTTADQLPLIQAGMTFSTVYSWTSTDLELDPAPLDMDLPAGDYLVFAANVAGDGMTHGSLVLIDEWQEL